MPDLPVYEPCRDHRFEYVTDALDWLEAHWCRRGPDGCRHAVPAAAFPSHACPLDLHRWFNYVTIPEVLDAGEDGLVCSKYVDARTQDGPDLFGGE